MEFRDWLLNEIGDITNLSTDGIKIKHDEEGAYFTFDHGEQFFKVKIYPANVSFRDLISIPNSYQVSFEGSNGTYLTGLSGHSAHVIYTQVLLGIRKFLEEEVVNALYFEGAQEQMNLLYRRFYKQFLQKDFIQVSDNKYINKEYLRKIMGRLSPKNQEVLYNRIISNNRDYLDKLKGYRDDKKVQRKRFQMMKVLVGRFIYSHHNSILNYVLNVNQGRTFEVLQWMPNLNKVVVKSLPYYDVSNFKEYYIEGKPLPQPQVEHIKRFLMTAKTSEYADFIPQQFYIQHGV